MQFRCKVASAAGQVTQGTYVADSELALRHELESKGLFLLSLQRVGGVGVIREDATGQSARIAVRHRFVSPPGERRPLPGVPSTP